MTKAEDTRRDELLQIERDRLALDKERLSLELKTEERQAAGEAARLAREEGGWRRVQQIIGIAAAVGGALLGFLQWQYNARKLELDDQLVELERTQSQRSNKQRELELDLANRELQLRREESDHRMTIEVTRLLFAEQELETQDVVRLLPTRIQPQVLDILEPLTKDPAKIEQIKSARKELAERLATATSYTVTLEKIDVLDDSDYRSPGEIYLTYDFNGITGQWPSGGRSSPKQIQSGNSEQVGLSFPITLARDEYLDVIISGFERDDDSEDDSLGRIHHTRAPETLDGTPSTYTSLGGDGQFRFTYRIDKAEP